VFEAIRAGASGFLLKDCEPSELLRAVRVVAQGEALLAPSVTRKLITAFAAQPRKALVSPPALADLTDREREVMGLVAAGRTNEEISVEHGHHVRHGQDPRQPRDGQNSALVTVPNSWLSRTKLAS
jgi:DNA-binding NarL/FixJ family response regulator